MTNLFGKNESKIMYALAAILMIILHIYNAPTRIPRQLITEQSILGLYSLEMCIADFAAICIHIYAFISGYGLYVAFKNIDNSMKSYYLSQIKRLINFYKIFWLVFIIFIPYGVITGIFHTDFKHLLLTIIGKDNKFNYEWWYVWMYVKILFWFPVFYKFLDIYDKTIIKYNRFLMVTLMIALIIIKAFLTDGRPCVEMSFIGAIFAKYKLFDLAFEKIEKLKIPYWIIGYILLFLCIITFDVLYKFYEHKLYPYSLFEVPIFIFSIILITRYVRFWGFSKLFIFIGKYSVFIWLTHSFICYYYWQPYVTWLKYSFLIVLWVLLLSTILSVLLDKIYKFLFNKN